MYLPTEIALNPISNFIPIVPDVLNVRVAIHVRSDEKYKSLSQFSKSSCLLETFL